MIHLLHRRRRRRRRILTKQMIIIRHKVISIAVLRSTTHMHQNVFGFLFRECVLVGRSTDGWRRFHMVNLAIYSWQKNLATFHAHKNEGTIYVPNVERSHYTQKHWFLFSSSSSSSSSVPSTTTSRCAQRTWKWPKMCEKKKLWYKRHFRTFIAAHLESHKHSSIAFGIHILTHPLSSHCHCVTRTQLMLLCNAEKINENHSLAGWWWNASEDSKYSVLIWLSMEIGSKIQFYWAGGLVGRHCLRHINFNFINIMHKQWPESIHIIYYYLSAMMSSEYLFSAAKRSAHAVTLRTRMAMAMCVHAHTLINAY